MNETIKQVAKKSRKPRVAMDVLTGLSIFLTFLSVAPYQLGDVAVIVPPEMKPWLFFLSSLATVALQVIRPYMRSPNLPTENKPL